METVAVKRKRTQNFNAEEKMLFVRTLQDMGHVLITKVTSHDYRTNKEKEAVWEKITNHLNASGSVRNVDSYKKLWAKMKSDAKTYQSKALLQCQGTGGGPPKFHPDPVLDAVIEITGRGSTGIERIIDADTVNYDHIIVEEEVEVLAPSEFLIQPDQFETLMDDAISSEKILNEKNSNKENQKTPVNNNNYKRRRPMLAHINERTTPRETKLAEVKLQIEAQKLELLKVQEEQMKELHEIKKRNEERLQLLKEGILEDIRKKIRDGEKVDSDIFKTIL